jgi:hypothetical protein
MGDLPVGIRRGRNAAALARDDESPRRFSPHPGLLVRVGLAATVPRPAGTGHTGGARLSDLGANEGQDLRVGIRGRRRSAGAGVPAPPVVEGVYVRCFCTHGGLPIRIGFGQRHGASHAEVALSPRALGANLRLQIGIR